MKPILKKDYVQPVVTFTETAYNKMWALVDYNTKEIGWHGTVERKDNTFVITDILVYPQAVDATSIVADEAKFAEWLDGYRLDLNSNVFDKLRMHGHSHVNMGTSPSATDTKLQEDHLAQLQDNDFYIFLIVNKKREIWCTIYDTVTGLQYETKDIQIIPVANKETEWAIKETKEKVTKYKPTVYTYNKNKNNKNNKKNWKDTAALLEMDDDILEDYYYGDAGYPIGDERNFYYGRRNK